MDDEVDDWEDALRRLVDEALNRTRLESVFRHYERVRRIKAPSAKLVYLFLKDHQPQSLASLRRTLGISRNSAPRAVTELVELGVVVRDDQFLYWVTPLEAGKDGG